MLQKTVRKRFVVALGVTLIVVKWMIPFLTKYTADFNGDFLPDLDYLLSLLSIL